MQKKRLAPDRLQEIREEAARYERALAIPIANVSAYPSSASEHRKDLLAELDRLRGQNKELLNELAEQEKEKLALVLELEDAHAQHMVWHNLYAEEADVCNQRVLLPLAWMYFFRDSLPGPAIAEALGIDFYSNAWLEEQLADMARVVISIQLGTPAKLKHRKPFIPLVNPNIPTEILERARQAVALVMAQQKAPAPPSEPPQVAPVAPVAGVGGGAAV
jgi:hypothetical protein